MFLCVAHIGLVLIVGAGCSTSTVGSENSDQRIAANDADFRVTTEHDFEILVSHLVHTPDLLTRAQSLLKTSRDAVVRFNAARLMFVADAEKFRAFEQVANIDWAARDENVQLFVACSRGGVRRLGSLCHRRLADTRRNTD